MIWNVVVAQCQTRRRERKKNGVALWLYNITQNGTEKKERKMENEKKKKSFISVRPYFLPNDRDLRGKNIFTSHYVFNLFVLRCVR